MNNNSIATILDEHPIIPVATINHFQEVDRIVKHLLHNNIRVIEVTLRSEVALSVISYIRENYENSMLVGAGTIINAELARLAEDHGASFLISPGITPSLYEQLKNGKLPYLFGVNSPSDIMLGLENDDHYFKFFPAELSGGVEMLSTFSTLFPTAKFCPTGGITKDTFEHYLSLPNVSSVGGSWMLNNLNAQ